MKYIYLLLSVFLTIWLVMLWMRSGRCTAAAEGFASGAPARPASGAERPKSADFINPLRAMIQKLTHMSRHFSSVDTWRDRIETAFLSPTELARRYIANKKRDAV
jgi:hypothetical protein